MEESEKRDSGRREGGTVRRDGESRMREERDRVNGEGDERGRVRRDERCGRQREKREI